VNARLIRLTSLLAGYVALLLLDRSWQLLEERAAAVTDVAEATLGALAAVDELVAFDVSDVIAAHDCVCCRSGAASWPPAATQGASEGAA
jgi:hypothetical protein